MSLYEMTEKKIENFLDIHVFWEAPVNSKFKINTLKPLPRRGKIVTLYKLSTKLNFNYLANENIKFYNNVLAGWD